jgi:hypothetical protein
MSTIEPRMAAITAGAVLILAMAGFAAYVILNAVPVAWPPSAGNVVTLGSVAVFAIVVVGGLQLWIRRHATLRFTAEGIEVATLWGRRQIPWHAVTVVRRSARAGVTIESTMGSFSLAVLLFRPTNGLVNVLENHLGSRAVELPRFEE